MSLGLKFVALISGGKDSLFSILHCLANNHELVALGNLYPEISSDDQHGGDIDSYMYQTVGHDVVPLYEEALGVPLYRQPIRGGAVCTKKEYERKSSPSNQHLQEDETESLVPLLQHIMKMHPEVNAVSTGAILSTYQRTRVESVAIRLKLIPLSYLWQYPSLPPYTQSSLLTDMASVGQESILIKVASGGLDASFLGEDVASQKTITKLRKVMKRFGGGDGAILGEGGEFETLALDGPRPLWKKRVCVDVARTIVGEGGTAVLEFSNARLEEKGKSDRVIDYLQDIRKPDIFDDEFKTLISQLDLDFQDCIKEETIARNMESEDHSQGSTLNASISQTNNLISFANMHSDDQDADAALQLQEVFNKFGVQLIEHGLSPACAILCNLLLRSMSDFNAVNNVYQNFFNEANPPARVTVACGEELPPNVHVLLTVLLLIPGGPEEEAVSSGVTGGMRRALHVQSRSYWAPANIGPYSQAVAVRSQGGGNPSSASFSTRIEQIYIAGQIPLEPATMYECPPLFSTAATLALQHTWRIGRAMNVDGFCNAVALISRSSTQEARRRAVKATGLWIGLYKTTTENPNGVQEDEDVDVWDRQNNRATNGEVGEEQDQRPELPNMEHISSALKIPACFVAEVSELPRGANIEWVSHGISKGIINYRTQRAGENLIVNIAEIEATSKIYLSAGIAGNDEFEAFRATFTDVLGYDPKDESSKAMFTVYYVSRLPNNWIIDAKPMLVPCRSLWNGGKILLAVILVTAEKKQDETGE